MYFGNMFDPRQPPRATPLRPSAPKKPSAPSQAAANKAVTKAREEYEIKKRKKKKQAQ